MPHPLWQVVREDAARVQQLLRSQTAELTASQMLVKQLEGVGPAAAPHDVLQELQKQLQVVFVVICDLTRLRSTCRARKHS